MRAPNRPRGRAHPLDEGGEIRRRSGRAERGQHERAEQGEARGEGHADGLFELLDRLSSRRITQKAEVVRRSLDLPQPAPGAAPFYDGMRLLGPRTPELSLIALRLVLAGKSADDASVVHCAASSNARGRETRMRAPRIASFSRPQGTERHSASARNRSEFLTWSRWQPDRKMFFSSFFWLATAGTSRSIRCRSMPTKNPKFARWAAWRRSC